MYQIHLRRDMYVYGSIPLNTVFLGDEHAYIIINPSYFDVHQGQMAFEFGPSSMYTVFTYIIIYIHTMWRPWNDYNWNPEIRTQFSLFQRSSPSTGDGHENPHLKIAYFMGTWGFRWEYLMGNDGGCSWSGNNQSNSGFHGIWWGYFMGVNDKWRISPFFFAKQRCGCHAEGCAETRRGDSWRMFTLTPG